MVTITEFLAAFYPDSKEPIHLRAFVPRGATGRPEKRTATRARFMNDTALLDDLATVNRTHGVYFVVNAGGNKDVHVTGGEEKDKDGKVIANHPPGRFNACFAESDDQTIEEQHAKLDACPLPPSIRNETKKSVHAYWLLAGDNPGDKCEEDWRDVQRRLIAYFGSDEAIKNPARVMRVPGFDHVSADGSRKCVKCVVFEPERRYTLGELLAAFPQVSEKTLTVSRNQAGRFATWDALRAELGRRIEAHESARRNGRGKIDCRGICHNGNGETGLFYDPSTNKAICNKGCDQATILRAFGLPEKPSVAAGKGEPNGHQTQQTGSGKEIPLSVKRLSDVAPETIDWLWFPYLPLGKLILLEGDPGLGKSWLTCALATGVAAGNGLPGTEPTEPRNVLMLSAEDGLADTIRPRLDSMNADVSRIYALETPVTFDDAGLRAVEGVIAEIEPALVIVDPIVAYFGGGVDLHRANETREVMARLALAAAKFRCAILCVRHLAKGGTNKAIYRGLGSIDIAAAVRSVLLVGADPDQPSKRAIVQIKNNLAAFGEPIGYELKEGAFYWTGASNLTAERILNSHAASEEDSLERRDAEKFLRELLADGEVDAKEVESARKAAGVSEYSLRKAKATLSIKTRKLGGTFSVKNSKTGWAWSLPEDIEDVEKSIEDVEKVSPQHLQASYSDKSSYSNELAEGVEGVVSQRLQSIRLTPSTPSGGGRERLEI